MTLGGAQANQQGTIVVHGRATLAGELDVVIVNNFVPADGDLFSVLDYEGVVGAFDSETVFLDCGWYLEILYGDRSLQLRTVNQPM